MEPTVVTKRAWWKPVVAGCLALLVVACASKGASGGQSSSAPSSSTPTSPPVSVLCADAAALQTSLDKLAHVKVREGAVSEITS
ncbi:MAG TPA: hypothetical protein VIV12_28875, partial [Streptosporangiaceae bacterium]